MLLLGALAAVAVVLAQTSQESGVVPTKCPYLADPDMPLNWDDEACPLAGKCPWYERVKQDKTLLNDCPMAAHLASKDLQDFEDSKLICSSTTGDDNPECSRKQPGASKCPYIRSKEGIIKHQESDFKHSTDHKDGSKCPYQNLEKLSTLKNCPYKQHHSQKRNDNDDSRVHSKCPHKTGDYHHLGDSSKCPHMKLNNGDSSLCPHMKSGGEHVKADISKCPYLKEGATGDASKCPHMQGKAHSAMDASACPHFGKKCPHKTGDYHHLGDSSKCPHMKLNNGDSSLCPHMKSGGEHVKADISKCPYLKEGAIGDASKCPHMQGKAHSAMDASACPHFGKKCPHKTGDYPHLGDSSKCPHMKLNNGDSSLCPHMKSGGEHVKADISKCPYLKEGAIGDASKCPHMQGKSHSAMDASACPHFGKHQQRNLDEEESASHTGSDGTKCPCSGHNGDKRHDLNDIDETTTSAKKGVKQVDRDEL